MSRRARASVHEATTLAKPAHRWQACRARPRCASTPTGKCCNSSPRHLHACRSSIHSPSDTCIERPSTVACRGVHVRRWTKPPRLLRLCTDGRPAEHGLGAPPRRLATAAACRVAISTRAVAASTLEVAHVHRAAFNGAMSRRALASVDEATTLATTVRRWQACRARPRCAATPAAKCCNTPYHRLHACDSGSHS